MLTDGHIVPKAVLKALCRWRAGLPVKNSKENEKRYMFRTDIEGGMHVSAKECTTKFNKLFCGTCEELLQKIDTCASDFWDRFVENWTAQPNFEVAVALASMMARAMYISQHCDQKKLRKELFTTIEGSKDDSAHRLNRLGFLCCKLPPYQRYQGYQVEFLCFCDVIVGQQRMQTICTQVPPFFCLLPYEPEHADVLKHCLYSITNAVRTKLDKALKDFYTQATQSENDMMRRFSEWYTTIDASGTGPLLVFDYLGEHPLEIDVRVFNRA